MSQLLDDLAQRARSFSTNSGFIALSDHIDAIGFGSYQIQVFILSAGFIVAEGSELQMASGLTNAISDEFGITSHMGRSMLMTLVFFGFAAGTIASGPVGDIFGRRLPMLIGYVGVICTASVTYFAPSAVILYLLRFILGFFGGIGIPTALITISEVSPKQLRGVSTAALGVAYCLGDLWAAMGLWFILPELQDGPWRRLVLWAAFPAACLFLFSLVSPVSRYDTPAFMSTRGGHQDLIKCVNLMAELNGRPDLVLSEDEQIGIQPPDSKSHAASFWDAAPMLLQWPLVLHSAVLCLLFFGKDFCLYGMSVFWPLAWAQLEGIQRLSPAAELVLTALLGVPGIGVAMSMMSRMDRRPAIAIGGVACAAAAILIRRLQVGDPIGLVGVLLFKVFFPTWQMVTMLLPSELFPTQIRSWAYGCVAVFGRIATILAPTIVECGHGGFLLACAVLGFASALAAPFLPETKDITLVDTPQKIVSSEMDYGSMKATA